MNKGFLAVLLLGLLAGSTQADFSISLQQDVTITVNGTATMDVFIEGQGYSLGSFQYMFEITGPQNLGIVQFGTNQIDPNTISGINNEPYIFSGDSFWVSSFPQLEYSNPDRSRIIAADTLQVSESPVELGSGKYLLGRLSFEHLGEAATDGFFTVSLVANESFFDTDFIPDNNNNLPVNAASAQLKIVATPEPTTIGALALVLVGGGSLAKRRSRKMAH